VGPEPAIRGPWGALATVGLTLVIAGVVLLVQGIIAFAYLLLTVKEKTLPAIEAAVAPLQSDGLFLGMVQVGTALTVVPLVYALAWARRGPAVRDYLGLRAVPRADAFRWLFYTVLLMVLLEVAAYLTTQPTPEWMKQVFRSAGSMPLLLFGIVVIAPVIEELVFRGFLFEGLRNSRLGEAGAVILTSLVFASIHVQYEAFAVGQVLAIGLLLGTARARTGSVLLAIAMHTLVNAVATLQLAVELR
jgi:membrane protease YdiL (CAAX protease family)